MSDILKRLQACFIAGWLPPERALALEAANEIARLRESRKPVGWCVRAAAGTTVHAGSHLPVDAAVVIQCPDEAYARMLSAVYKHKVLMIVEVGEKEVNRE